MTRVSEPIHRIWTAPAVIGSVTLFSLIGALVADGVLDWVFALLLLISLSYATVLGLRAPTDRRS